MRTKRTIATEMRERLETNGVPHDGLDQTDLVNLEGAFEAYAAEKKSLQASPYIDIIRTGASPSGKTQIYIVVNKQNGLHDQPGFIKWNGGWRKYVYYSGEAYYDAACLHQIANFCEAATEAQSNGYFIEGTATLKEYGA